MASQYSRRDFLIGSGSMALTVFTPALSWMTPSHARANLIERNRNVLVVVFLRGGFDGLGLLCPATGADRAAYEASRPNVGIPTKGPDAGRPLADDFLINPAAQPLQSLFEQRHLAFVHACGLPKPSRSHFAAQSLVELGNAHAGEFATGWITRFLKLSPCKIAAIGNLKPASLIGHENLLLVPRLKGLGLDGSPAHQRQIRSLLRGLYSNDKGKVLYGHDALNMLDEVENLSLAALAKNLPDLPSGEIAQKFSLAAQLIQHDPQLGMVTLDIGGWDTHRQQGTNGDGYYARQLANISQAMHDFHRQMMGAGNAWVTTLVLSEFGRRLKENASRGTDHGNGNVVMLKGARVKGGRLHGQWPGLAHDKLFERADLAATTDIRNVMHEFLKIREPGLKFESIFGGKQQTHQLDLFHSS